MKSFTITKLPHAEMKFKEWKIRENSKLSYGDPILIYEYQKNGVSKKDKLKSNLNGITVVNLKEIKTDQILMKDMQLFTYETCKHPVISNEMCGVCGEDLKTQNEISKKVVKSIVNIEESASVKIVHAEPSIKVSKNEALEIGKRDLNNLVQQKKLVLLVDLDHTVIHTTNDNVSNEVKDVYHYELWQRNVWYHTKFRPNCKKFLEEMSKMFELHMVTFGERSYAHKIAGFMDPDRRFFHDRILSRNEIFNPISKTDNLKALFPRGDLMVCIIDDREDVWNYARNLICVQPYVYFKNTGDINDPHKSGRSSKKRKVNENQNLRKEVSEETVRDADENLNVEENLTNILTDSKSNELTIDNNSVDSTSSSGSTDSSSDMNKKKVRFTEDSLKKNKISEKNKENSSDKNTTCDEQYNDLSETESVKNTNNTEDKDNYLDYLEKILKKIHNEYYKIYENRIKSKGSSSGSELDESDLPDVKRVIPILKSRILENVVITFSGVVPTDYDLKKQRCYLMATSLGARVNEHLVLGDESDSNDSENENSEAPKKTSRNYEYSYDESSSSNTSGGDSKLDSSFSSTSNDSVALSVSNDAKIKKKKKKRYTTHLVAAKYGTSKVHEALKSKRKVKVVTPEWLINCNFKWEKCDETLYALTKEYECKNCSFHADYNLHQKYGMVPNSSSANVISKSFPDQSMSSSKRQFTEISKSTFQKSNVKEDEKMSKNAKVKKTDSFFTSETFYSEQGLKDDEFDLDENLLDQMDKEVEQELDDESSDFDEEDENDENPTISDKSSSLNSFDEDDDNFDIDDEMVLALEKNF